MLPFKKGCPRLCKAPIFLGSWRGAMRCLQTMSELDSNIEKTSNCQFNILYKIIASDRLFTTWTAISQILQR